jgi:hypothetical protein
VRQASGRRRSFQTALCRPHQFRRHIAHGLYTASLISAVLGTRPPGAIYIAQTLNFRAPVKIGDTVTVIVTVAELMPEKSRVHLTCVCKVGRQVVLDGEVPREEKGKRSITRFGWSRVGEGAERRADACRGFKYGWASLRPAHRTFGTSPLGCARLAQAIICDVTRFRQVRITAGRRPRSLLHSRVALSVCSGARIRSSPWLSRCYLDYRCRLLALEFRQAS